MRGLGSTSLYSALGIGGTPTSAPTSQFSPQMTSGKMSGPGGQFAPQTQVSNLTAGPIDAGYQQSFKVPSAVQTLGPQRALSSAVSYDNSKAAAVGGYQNVVPSRVQTMKMQGIDPMTFATGTDYGARDAVMATPNRLDMSGGVKVGNYSGPDAVSEARAQGAKPTWNPYDPRNAVLNAYNG